ncbi:P-loop containing nucleoside triphosphate hydrolase protein [Mycena vulgaris]|nr:P-loop containing nucleoside triphosphate hydrolase protein [Mycena vulgaris]
MAQPHPFLNSLNAAQLQASPSPLFKLLLGLARAKRRRAIWISFHRIILILTCQVLTSRTAYLILHHLLPSSSICAVTFTNKAANEMRERLSKLIGKKQTSEARMGTFHALCALFLRKSSKVVGIEGNFPVRDSEESKKIISGLLKPYKDFLSSKDGTVLSSISKAKSKSLTAKHFIAEHSKVNNDRKSSDFDSQDDIQHLVGKLYQDLDFDDLLLFGVKLFTEHPPATNWCRRVLVDEFQDTNVTQYELMRAIGAPTGGCVTVVGDPDQSIYGGWESGKNAKGYCWKKTIVLRALFSRPVYVAIVSQDKSRIPKTLLTSHSSGKTAVLHSFPSEHAEANFIAIEIKRVVASMGGVLRWGDFAILLPCRARSKTHCAVLGGHKFFERIEIKDLLAYLQLIDNPNFIPALTRAINVPGRDIGDKSLIARADKTKMSPLEIIELIHDAKQPAVKHKVGPFVKAVRVLRKLATEASPCRCLSTRADRIRGPPEEDAARLGQSVENVQALNTFASEVEHDVNLTSVEPATSDTPLRLFLQASMLSSEGDNRFEEDSKEKKVTISTCHVAKGLKWPVGWSKGRFPSRCAGGEVRRYSSQSHPSSFITGGKVDLLIASLLSGTKIWREAIDGGSAQIHVQDPRALLAVAGGCTVFGDNWSPKLDPILPPLLRAFHALPTMFSAVAGRDEFSPLNDDLSPRTSASRRFK